MHDEDVYVLSADNWQKYRRMLLLNKTAALGALLDETQRIVAHKGWYLQNSAKIVFRMTLIRCIDQLMAAGDAGFLGPGELNRIMRKGRKKKHSETQSRAALTRKSRSRD
jgi:hypothetical protein